MLRLRILWLLACRLTFGTAARSHVNPWVVGDERMVAADAPFARGPIGYDSESHCAPLLVGRSLECQNDILDGPVRMVVPRTDEAVVVGRNGAPTCTPTCPCSEPFL